MVASSSSTTSRPIALFGLFLTGVFLSVCLGAFTNFVNGAVSPLYFIKVMGWQGAENIQRASIAQGIFEGLMLGALLSFVFTIVVGIRTKASCSYALGLRYLLLIMLEALGFWIIGGVLAMGLASLSPEFFRSAFIGVPKPSNELLKYAWVGGSITGLQLGGLMALTFNLVLFGANWKQKGAIKRAQ